MDQRRDGTDEPTFSCTRCGQCCRNVEQHEWYRSLNRGDGLCRYLDEETNLCTVYEVRPDECRIDLMYERMFAEYMPREAYYAANTVACADLQVKHDQQSRRSPQPSDNQEG